MSHEAKRRNFSVFFREAASLAPSEKSAFVNTVSTMQANGTTGAVEVKQRRYVKSMLKLPVLQNYITIDYDDGFRVVSSS